MKSRKVKKRIFPGKNRGVGTYKLPVEEVVDENRPELYEAATYSLLSYADNELSSDETIEIDKKKKNFKPSLE